jgi:polysaccharide deacetylase
VLPSLPADLQWREIHESRQQLEAILGAPVTTFGYPHGRATSETARLVRQAGFVCAGGSEGGIVTRNSDPYLLPRMLVRDSDGDDLHRRLRRWFDA